MHGLPQRYVQQALQRVLERLPKMDLSNARLFIDGLQAKVIVQKWPRPLSGGRKQLLK
jgi:hypothetical protein